MEEQIESDGRAQHFRQIARNDGKLAQDPED